MALDLKPVNGRLELTSVSVRLGKISDALSNDEAVNFSQLTALTDRVAGLEAGTDDVDRIEFATTGTATAPTLTWNSDTDTGMYRIGANNIGITCNGADVLNIATTGLTVTGLVSASTTVTAGTLLLSGDGAVGAPAHTFTSDTDCGMYRIGANNIGISAGGSKIIDITTAGASVVGTFSASTTVSAGTLLLTGDGAVGASAWSFTSDTDSGVYRIGANNIGVAVGGTKIIDVASTGITVTGTVSASTLFLAGNGAVGAPAFAFTSDTDCGMYRIGANNIGLVVNGANVIDIATTGITVTGTITASTSITATTTVTATTLFFSGDGAVGAPTYSFVSDTNTGMYRIGADNIGVACAGAKVLDVSASGLGVTGAITATTSMTATTTVSAIGHLYTPTITVSGAGTPQTLNTYAGTVTMTGIADIAADGTGSVVINNSLVTASTVALVAMQTTTAAAGSTPRIETITYGAGTITIAIRNSDSATATGACTYVFSFILFKL